jgi:hypothetical protein
VVVYKLTFVCRANLSIARRHVKELARTIHPLGGSEYVAIPGLEEAYGSWANSKLTEGAEPAKLVSTAGCRHRDFHLRFVSGQLVFTPTANNAQARSTGMPFVLLPVRGTICGATSQDVPKQNLSMGIRGRGHDDSSDASPAPAGSKARRGLRAKGGADHSSDLYYRAEPSLRVENDLMPGIACEICQPRLETMAAKVSVAQP